MTSVARALYDYEAKSAQELSIKAGDSFAVLHKHESGWWIIEHNTKKGAVPGSYCKEITPMSNQVDKKQLNPPLSPRGTTTSSPTTVQLSPRGTNPSPTNNSASSPTQGISTNFNPPANCTFARAIQEFQSKSSGQISYEKDDILFVFDKFPTGWWKGSLKKQPNKIGLFPAGSVVEITFQEAAKEVTKETTTTSHVTAPVSLSDRPESGPFIAMPSATKPTTSSNVASSPPTISTSALSTPTNSDRGRLGSFKAIYKFEAKGPEQVSFNPGDQIEVLEELPKGWVRGSVYGRIGLVPSNYLQRDSVTVSLLADNHMTLPFAVRATHNYTAPNQGDLAFSRGDEILVIERIGKGWYKGQLKDKIGKVPQTYVEILPQPSSQTETSSPSASTVPSPRKMSEEVVATTTIPTPEYTVLCNATVMFDFTPTDTATQLHIKAGEVIEILEKSESGWWLSRHNNKIGNVPASYVEQVVLPPPIVPKEEIIDPPTTISKSLSLSELAAELPAPVKISPWTKTKPKKDEERERKLREEAERKADEQKKREMQELLEAERLAKEQEDKRIKEEEERLAAEQLEAEKLKAEQEEAEKLKAQKEKEEEELKKRELELKQQEEERIAQEDERKKQELEQQQEEERIKREEQLKKEQEEESLKKQQEAQKDLIEKENNKGNNEKDKVPKTKEEDILLREEAINLAKEEADRRAKEELNSKKTPPSSPPHSDKWESAKPNENNKQTKRLSGKVTLISSGNRSPEVESKLLQQAKEQREKRTLSNRELPKIPTTKPEQIAELTKLVADLTNRLDEKDKQINTLQREVEDLRAKPTATIQLIASDMDSEAHNKLETFVGKLFAEVESLSKKVKRLEEERDEQAAHWPLLKQQLRLTGVDLSKR